jgi:hypothetical protein
MSFRLCPVCYQPIDPTQEHRECRHCGYDESRMRLEFRGGKWESTSMSHVNAPTAGGGYTDDLL